MKVITRVLLPYLHPMRHYTRIPPMFVALLALLCSCTRSSKPSGDLIAQDCDRLTRETDLYLWGHPFGGSPETNLFDSTQKPEILGISVDGAQAIVSVKVALSNKGRQLTIAEPGGKGFAKYFAMTRPPETIMPSQTVFKQAKLVYRRYDTGWKLEEW